MCAGAAAGVASRASHDAAGHLPAGRGEAEEAGTPGGLVVLALPLMGVEGHCASNSQVVVTADGVIVSQGSRTANQTHNTRHEISRAACIFCTAGARSLVSESDSVRPLSAPSGYKPSLSVSLCLWGRSLTLLTSLVNQYGLAKRFENATSLVPHRMLVTPPKHAREGSTLVARAARAALPPLRAPAARRAPG